MAGKKGRSGRQRTLFCPQLHDLTKPGSRTTRDACRLCKQRQSQAAELWDLRERGAIVNWRNWLNWKYQAACLAAVCCRRSGAGACAVRPLLDLYDPGRSRGSSLWSASARSSASPIPSNGARAARSTRRYLILPTERTGSTAANTIPLDRGRTTDSRGKRWRLLSRDHPNPRSHQEVLRLRPLPDLRRRDLQRGTPVGRRTPGSIPGRRDGCDDRQ